MESHIVSYTYSHIYHRYLKYRKGFLTATLNLTTFREDADIQYSTNEEGTQPEPRHAKKPIMPLLSDSEGDESSSEEPPTNFFTVSDAEEEDGEDNEEGGEEDDGDEEEGGRRR